MKYQSDNLTFLLLSWVKIMSRVNIVTEDKQHKKSSLKKLEDSLKKLNISNLNIIHESQDYYTLRYFRNGRLTIKQFTTDEVENKN